MPFGLGFGELLLIVGLLVLVFGAKRIPQIASGLGSGIRNFKTEVKDPKKSLDSGLDSDPGTGDDERTKG